MYSITVSVCESIYINRYVHECVLFTSVCSVRGRTWAFPVSGNEIWNFSCFVLFLIGWSNSFNVKINRLYLQHWVSLALLALCWYMAVNIWFGFPLLCTKPWVHCCNSFLHVLDTHQPKVNSHISVVYSYGIHKEIYHNAKEEIYRGILEEHK